MSILVASLDFMTFSPLFVRVSPRAFSSMYLRSLGSATSDWSS